MSPIENPAIPDGSTVLITGVNGLIGSHVADQFLHYGYKVRGTVRNVKKNAWLQELFDKKYGSGKFELVLVPDMMAEGTYDDAIKGVSAVIHIATIKTWDPDPHQVIPGTIAAALNALKATNKEVSVKRFVFTSSATAATLPAPDVDGIVIDENTWNEGSVKKAWSPPPYGKDRVWDVYGASKTQSEQEIFKFIKEEGRPDLVVNTVLPGTNLGPSVDPVNQGYPSTAAFIPAIWNNDDDVETIVTTCLPQYHIDNQDTGRLHVAAAIHPDVKGERVFAFNKPYNFDMVLEIMRKQNPNRKFIDGSIQSGRDLSVCPPIPRAEKLLRALGRPGFVSLEDSVWGNTELARASSD